MASRFDFENVLNGLEATSEKLYEEKNFNKVEDMLTTLIKDIKNRDSVGEDSRKLLARAYNNRGHGRYMRVEFDAAVEDYDQAISQSDRLAAAFFNRATVRYRLGEHKKALPDFIRATHLEPDNADFKEGLHLCQTQRNDQTN